MAKGYGFSRNRTSTAPGTGPRASTSAFSTSSSNSRMWSQPATAKQIAALKAHGNFDGKYYSKGRAGQTIGQTVRTAGSAASSPTRSASGPFNPLMDAVLDHLTSQRPTPAQAPTASTAEAARAVATKTAPDHYVLLEEGTNMSQLVPVRSVTRAHNIASVVELSTNVTAEARPFGYIPELVSTLLKPLVTTSDPSQVRALEKALTVAKGTLAKSLARARNELIGVLRDAPSGTFASAEAKADEILWSACSADLEDDLMKVTQASNGRTRPSKVIDELLAQVRHRVELARIEAADLVEVAKIQAALPPAATRGYEPCWGEVTGVKPYGAFVTLQSGESGLLHVSELLPLTGGRRVEDAGHLLKVGQPVYVRVTGKNEKGQLNFALASEVVA